jgi:hypothetical protein
MAKGKTLKEMKDEFPSLDIEFQKVKKCLYDLDPDDVWSLEELKKIAEDQAPAGSQLTYKDITLELEGWDNVCRLYAPVLETEKERLNRVRDSYRMAKNDLINQKQWAEREKINKEKQAKKELALYERLKKKYG